MTRFAILDQSATSQGTSHQATLQQTVEMAQHAERLGYARYWLAEHHNSPANVGTAPEILCATISAKTDHIRVGSAGVLLQHYSPLKVAEVFRVLSALAPGRIDLGIGRSPGGNPATVEALNRGARVKEHADAFRELLGWIGHSDDDPGQGGVNAFPFGVDGPEPWGLGSSLSGAMLAAELGTPFCFNYSHGTNFHLAKSALEAYRENFRPSTRCPRPVTSLSIWVLAAETAQEADYLFAPRAYWRVQLDRGKRGAMVPPDVALSERFTPQEQARVDEMRGYSIIGAADDVADRLRNIVTQFDVNEIVLATWTYEAKDRLHSYDLLAQRLISAS
ncbi:LLM class flavin-dependent oxidoreductase [Roseovarius aestuarii]|nr:LLM class flavin-dependent oxidoreductase [Roseovarius aestuarii]